MKCPNCHKEVEKGSLYCPHCLSEIPWVREFDSVETQLRKKEQQDSGEESDREGLSAGKFIYNRKRIIVVCLAAAALLGAFCYRQLHTFSALYSHASQQFEQEHYGAAARSIEAALEKKPNNESANILLAKCLEKQGKLKEGILILKPLVKNADAGVGVYQELVSLLAKNGQSAEVRDILQNSSKKVQEACGEYMCSPPAFSIAPGTYTSLQKLELSGDYQRIYYTLDGTDPTLESSVYTEPVELNEGTTCIKAIGVNAKNIISEVASGKYIIVLKTPAAPVVYPKSGDFSKETTIKVSVPDGCKAYYAFDREPDVNSTEYEQPISMPVGYHIFNVILVAANGKTSKLTSREYYLQY